MRPDLDLTQQEGSNSTDMEAVTSAGKQPQPPAMAGALAANMTLNTTRRICALYTVLVLEERLGM